MSDHSGLLDRYRRMREVQFRLNNLLVQTIPKKTLDECGRILGFLRKGVLFFETEDETSLLMDYCIFYPQPDGRNLVAKYLEKSPPADPDERDALRGMTHAYYSLFRVLDVERGTGVGVRDLLRGETGFIVDVGFGNTARRHMIVATRIIPVEGFLMTGGAGLPVDASTAERISKELKRTGYNPGTFDYKQITPRQEADVAAIVIRECRSTGMTSRIAYAEPGGRPDRPITSASEGRSRRRSTLCPCGSGKKYGACCGRR